MIPEKRMHIWKTFIFPMQKHGFSLMHWIGCWKSCFYMHKDLANQNVTFWRSRLPTSRSSKKDAKLSFSHTNYETPFKIIFDSTPTLTASVHRFDSRSHAFATTQAPHGPSERLGLEGYRAIVQTTPWVAPDMLGRMWRLKVRVHRSTNGCLKWRAGYINIFALRIATWYVYGCAWFLRN